MSASPQTAQSQPDQIALFHLLFANNWEDPVSDRRALQMQPGATVMTVTSGCCNTLTLLLDDPGKVYAVDINPTQSYLMELKCAAIRKLDHGELLAFLGLRPSADRMAVFERISGELSPAARAYWAGQEKGLREGIIHAGKFESLVRLVHGAIRLLQGRKRIEELFQCRSLAEQRAFFDRRWNTRRWRLIFRVLANKRVVARKMDLDYFQFEDGSTSFPESFQRRFDRAICDIPIDGNYFLAWFLSGGYRDEGGVPEYLLKENLPVVRERLDRIENIVAPAQEWMANQPAGSVDGFVLSNIGELMSEDETNRLFEALVPVAAAGARVCFRNIVVPRGVPESLAGQIVLDAELSRELLATDRSFLYSRVHSYVANPEH